MTVLDAAFRNYRDNWLHLVFSLVLYGKTYLWYITSSEIDMFAIYIVWISLAVGLNPILHWNFIFRIPGRPRYRASFEKHSSKPVGKMLVNVMTFWNCRECHTQSDTGLECHKQEYLTESGRWLERLNYLTNWRIFHETWYEHFSKWNPGRVTLLTTPSSRDEHWF
jgi:hypothetical protein